MIIVYDRDPDSTEYHAVAKWADGDWIEGEDLMSHLPDNLSADQILDRLGGPGNRTALQVEDPADAPDSFDPADAAADADETEDVPTVELDGTNWMNRRREAPEPKERRKPIEEMTEEEIRSEYSNADTIIESLRESDEDTVV